MDTAAVNHPAPRDEDVPCVEAPYVELHLHTCYSLLEGASSPKEMAARAAAQHYDTLAITDRNNLYGAMVFARACRDHNIHPIIGVELTVATDPDDDGDDRYDLTLLAENRQGYANLCRLVSHANGWGLDDQADRERRRKDPCVALHQLRDHTEGVVCLTGGRNGELARRIDAGDRAGAADVLRRWLDWFGPGNVWVELHDNLVLGDRPRIRAQVALARQLGVDVVATGDVHYHAEERHRLHDALCAIRHRTTLDECHVQRRPNSEFYLREPVEQQARFAEWPEAIHNTRRIADRCTFDLNDDLGYRLPTPPVPEGHTPDSYLRELCTRKLQERYTGTEAHSKARERLDEELKLIEHHRLSGFFLVYHEVLGLAREVATEVRGDAPRGGLDMPPGRGRGSSVSSIVCYLIGLSHIDPIDKNLFLGRFLNEAMTTLPDIDLDFPRDIRDRLFQRVYEHWGTDHAALVATFPRYRIRSAVRDLGKALGLPAADIDRLAKLAEGYSPANDVEAEIEKIPDLRHLAETAGWTHLIELAAQLANFPRHVSQHVGGVVIASDPLIDCVPIQPTAWPGRYVCQWDKDDIDDARMVKIDFLALGMLSLVEECLDLCATHRETLIDLSRIDIDDQRVYDRIVQGDTIGVFQIESRAQAGILPRTQPRSLDDLTAQVAIIRPGPIVGGAVSRFVEGKGDTQRRPLARLGHPSLPLEPIGAAARGARDGGDGQDGDGPAGAGQSINGRSAAGTGEIPECVRDVLEETFGVVLYQEQVVQVATQMGKFTPGDAETFRRAMGRKDWDDETRTRYWEKFLAGAGENGVSEHVAKHYFESLTGFAQFGFPKSHAAAFGLLAYQTAWLKEYYPAEFYCALFNNWPMGFYPPHVFTNDARRHDVEILRPEINTSQKHCTIAGTDGAGAVRIGLGYIRAMGAATADAILAERERAGDFRSLSDFARRTQLGGEPVENAIRAGAFDAFGLNRRELLWQLWLLQQPHQIRQHRQTRRSRKGSGRVHPKQLRLELSTEQDHVSLAGVSDYQAMADDYDVLGLSPEAHPMQFLRTDLEGVVLTSSELLAMPPRRQVDTAGMVVVRQRPGTAKGTVYLLLEDEHGVTNVVVGPRLYDRCRTEIRGSAFLRVTGLTDERAGIAAVVHARTVTPIDPTALRPSALRTPDGKSWG